MKYISLNDFKKEYTSRHRGVSSNVAEMKFLKGLLTLRRNRFGMDPATTSTTTKKRQAEEMSGHDEVVISRPSRATHDFYVPQRFVGRHVGEGIINILEMEECTTLPPILLEALGENVTTTTASATAGATASAGAGGGGLKLASVQSMLDKNSEGNEHNFLGLDPVNNKYLFGICGLNTDDVVPDMQKRSSLFNRLYPRRIELHNNIPGSFYDEESAKKRRGKLTDDEGHEDDEDDVRLMYMKITEEVLVNFLNNPAFDTALVSMRTGGKKGKGRHMVVILKDRQSGTAYILNPNGGRSGTQQHDVAAISKCLTDVLSHPDFHRFVEEGEEEEEEGEYERGEYLEGVFYNDDDREVYDPFKPYTVDNTDEMKIFTKFEPLTYHYSEQDNEGSCAAVSLLRSIFITYMSREDHQPLLYTEDFIPCVFAVFMMRVIKRHVTLSTRNVSKLLVSSGRCSDVTARVTYDPSVIGTREVKGKFNSTFDTESGDNSIRVKVNLSDIIQLYGITSGMSAEVKLCDGKKVNVARFNVMGVDNETGTVNVYLHPIKRENELFSAIYYGYRTVSVEVDYDNFAQSNEYALISFSSNVSNLRVFKLNLSGGPHEELVTIRVIPTVTSSFHEF